MGQYLEDKPLQQVLKTDMYQLWQKLLDDNECLRLSPLLYPHDKSTSLTQARDEMFSAIDVVFEKPNESISAGFELDASFLCSSFEDGPENDFGFIKTSYFASLSSKQDLIAITIGWQDCLILAFDENFSKLQTIRLQTLPKPSRKELSNSLENLKFVDLQFYNADVVSLLLSNYNDHKNQSYFLQIPLEQTRTNSNQYSLPRNINLCDVTNAHSIFDIIDNTSFKGMDNICTHLSVSGCRKVSVNYNYCIVSMMCF